jgi:hypothetical protein
MYGTGPIYEYIGEPVITGSVTWRSTKGYNMTMNYGHIRVKMCDTGLEKFGGYYQIKKVKAVEELNETRIVVSEHDGIVLPANETVKEAIDSAEMLAEVSVQVQGNDEFDDE